MLTSHKQGISTELLAESESDRTVLEATQEASFDGNYHTNFAAFRATIEQSMIELHDRKRDKLETMMTLNFQTLEKVSLMAA